MAFQPFGYRFEIRSQSAPSEVKAIIRSHKKDWFDPKKGARGWIAGPFICLWSSGFDRYGPMLFGRISRDNRGTRISGRAGSDLNGLVMLMILIPVLLLVFCQMIFDDSYAFKDIAIIGVLIAIGPLVLWMSHKDRHAADPLVRFLRDNATGTGRSLRKKATKIRISRPLSIISDGKNDENPATTDSIYDTLLGTGAGDFVVLALDAENYIQTASQGGGYILEMREGNHQRHYRAARRGMASSSDANSGYIFTFKEVQAAFMAYSSDAPMPGFLGWEIMQPPE
jgi:hypothetical protein